MDLRRIFRLLSFSFVTTLGFGQEGVVHVTGVTASTNDQSTFFLSNVSPDGMLHGEYQKDLYSYNATEVRRITSSDYGVTAFALFPDGKRLAAATLDGIQVIDIATGQGRTISAPGYASYLRVSPDGQTIFASVFADPTAVHKWFPFLWSVPVNGGAAVELALGSVDGRHVVTSDGTVVFSSPDPASKLYATLTPRNAYAMWPDGSIHQLTNFTATGIQRMDASRVNITADGSRILFTTTEYQNPNVPDQTTLKAWVTRLDGSALYTRQLGDPAQGSTQVTFSADGSLVAWSRNGQIHVENLEAGDDRVVANFTQSIIADVDFTPDNSHLAVAIAGPAAPTGGAVWSIEVASGSIQRLYGPQVPTGIAYGATPESLLTVYATNLTLDAVIAPSGYPLPQSIGGVSLLINGTPAPIVSISPWQITTQMPMDLPIDLSGLTACYCATVSVALGFGNGPPSRAVPAVVFAQNPYIINSVAYHATTGSPVDQEHPATPGERLILYATGLGVTNPLIPAGQPAPFSPPATLAHSITITIADGAGYQQFFQPTWAGLVPGTFGTYQVNFRLPDMAPAGSLQIGFGTAGNGLFWLARVPTSKTRIEHRPSRL